MSKKKLGETEKTVLVAVLALAGWLGLDALVKRAEKRGTASATGDSEPETAVERRLRAIRTRRRRRRTA